MRTGYKNRQTLLFRLINRIVVHSEHENISSDVFEILTDPLFYSDIFEVRGELFARSLSRTDPGRGGFSDVGSGSNRLRWFYFLFVSFVVVPTFNRFGAAVGVSVRVKL